MVFICYVAKYGPRSSSCSDVGGKHRSDIVKNETPSDSQCYVSGSEQRMSASGNTDDMVDGNSASCTLSLEQELTLTDVLEVLNCETVESCDVATNAAVSLPSFELQPTIASPQMPAQLASSEVENFNQSCSGSSISTPDCFVHSNSESTAGKLLTAESRSTSRRNPVAAAFASMLQNLQKKPS